MPNWQWSADFLTPVAVSAQSAAVGYPDERMITLDAHPLIRTWRSVNLVQHDQRVDFGGSVSAVAFALLNVNFATVSFAVSSDNIHYTFFPGSPFPVGTDHDGFRKLFVAYTDVSFRWFLFRIQAQTPVNGASYFEVGQVVVVASLNTFPTNPMPDLVETVGRPYLRSGTTDIAPVGLNRLTSEVQMLVPMAQQTQHREIALLGQHTPILIYKNAGQSQQVMLCRYRADIQARIGGTTFSVNPTFMEMV